jgi:hypothetical protein
MRRAKCVHPNAARPSTVRGTPIRSQKIPADTAVRGWKTMGAAWAGGATASTQLHARYRTETSDRGMLPFGNAR